MNKQDKILVDGIVENTQRDLFEVLLDNGQYVKCKLSGKIRMYKIRVVVADRVKVELSPYDLSRGRIIERL